MPSQFLPLTYHVLHNLAHAIGDGKYYRLMLLESLQKRCELRDQRSDIS